MKINVNLNQALIITGPTGVGKSEYAFDLAKQHNGEIISMDSCAVYKGFDIGSAKVSKELRKEIPHHLIDINNPDESYDAGCFFNDVNKIVKDILAKDKLPIIVGGSMMYLNTIINGLVEIPPIDLKYKEEAGNYIAEEGLDKAHQYLLEIDPETANKFSPNDPQRISRALSIYFATKTIPSEFSKQQTTKVSFDYDIKYLLPNDKDKLKIKLDTRFDNMIAKGLLAETKSIMDKYGSEIDSLRAVGYRQMVKCLLNEIELGEAIRDGKHASRRLYKQQMTWIKKFNPADTNIIKVD